MKRTRSGISNRKMAYVFSEMPFPSYMSDTEILSGEDRYT